MILSSTLASLLSASIRGSGRLPEIAKILAPVVQDAMESLRHDDEILLNLSTILVGIGVFLEYFEIRHELREKTGPFKFSHPEMPVWMIRAGFAGWLMIVVGVSGEFVFEGAVNTWSEELEGVSNTLLRDAQLTAADATREAGTAAQSSYRAQRSADAVGLEVGRFGSEEAVLSSKIKDDEATEAALQKALLPRGLDPSKLTAGLYPFVLWKVRLDTVGDAESLHTANLIASSLAGAHWIVPEIRADMGVDFPDGIQVKEHCVWSLANRGARTGCVLAGERLTKALSDAGLPNVTFTGTDDKLGDNSFGIIVGLRKVPGETVPNVSKQSQ